MTSPEAGEGLKGQTHCPMTSCAGPPQPSGSAFLDYLTSRAKEQNPSGLEDEEQ